MEYSCTLLKFPDLVGSPPLTRGIRKPRCLILNLLRFTPAHAGNTLLNQLNQSWYRVHPRSRGEYCPGKPLYLQFIGSPPLTRGIPCEDDRHDGTSRFTPAHAGNTWKYKNIRRSNQVHPRSRGEYTKKSLILSHFFQHPFSHFI